MSRVRYLSGRVNLTDLDPATLTAVSKALATLDAAGNAGTIEWLNTPRRPPQRPHDPRKPGQRSLQPQERLILDQWLGGREVWMGVGDIADRTGIPVRSLGIRLKALYDGGYLERHPLPRMEGERGRLRFAYKRVDRLTGEP